MQVEFDIQITEKDLYRFQLYNAFHGTQGWASIVLSLVALAMYITKFGQVPMTYSLLYLAFAVIFALYVPVTLFVQSRAQFKRTKAFQAPMHYVFDDEGINITAGEETGLLPWNVVYKVTCNKEYMFIFGSRVNAYIIPRVQIEDKKEEIVKSLNEKVESFRLKIKNL